MTDRRPPLDTAPISEVVDRVLTAHEDALAAVRAVARQVTEAADLVTGRFAAGGRLLLVAAPGPTARVADLVAADLAREFGLAAGAVERHADLAARAPTARDAVVVLVTTATADDPGIREALRITRGRRAALVLVTTTSGADEDADVVVAPVIGPEPVRGRDRMGAATALKAVLDALTTAVVARLGHVHDDLPVDLVAASDADREQVVAMVAELARVEADAARLAATAAGHDVRAAVVALAAGLDPSAAAPFARNRRTLRDALARLPRRPPPPVPHAAPATAPAPTPAAHSAGDERPVGQQPGG